MNEQEAARALLRAILAEQRKRIDELEQTILLQDQQLLTKDRLLEAYRNKQAGEAAGC
jgi:hypothetical protein